MRSKIYDVKVYVVVVIWWFFLLFKNIYFLYLGDDWYFKNFICYCFLVRGGKFFINF